MDRMPTIGVAASVPEDVIFNAPLSRKPACKAADRTSWACWGEAVRT